MKRVGDLHLHSVYSDGSLSPNELLLESQKNDLSFISITDHDTLDHLTSIKNVLLNDLNLEVIPGIELTAIYQDFEYHILGYFIDWKATILSELVFRISTTRDNRMKAIVDNLVNSGINISFDYIKSKAKKGFVSRNNIAEVLLEQGYVKSIKEAFNPEFIGKGGKNYVERAEVSPEEIIEAIHQSGGIPVLAHPGNTPGFVEGVSYKDLVVLKDIGLKGLEVFQPKHSIQETRKYVGYAKKLNLLMFGGSDFHGFYSPDIKIGDIKLPYIFLDIIKSSL